MSLGFVYRFTACFSFPFLNTVATAHHYAFNKAFPVDLSYTEKNFKTFTASVVLPSRKPWTFTFFKDSYRNLQYHSFDTKNKHIFNEAYYDESIE